MADEDDIDEVERELLQQQPDALSGVSVMHQLDMFHDAYEEEDDNADGKTMPLQNVSRQLAFQQHTEGEDGFLDAACGLEHDDAVMGNEDEHRWANDTATAPQQGLLELPPLESDSVMIRGDNGVCRWSTMRQQRDDADAREAETQRRNDSRGVGLLAIDALLAEYHDHRVDRDALHHAAEAERTQRRIEVHASAGVSAASKERAEGRGGGSADLWVSKYQPRTFKELLSDETANLRIVQWVSSWNDYVFDSSGRATTTASLKGRTATVGKAPTRGGSAKPPNALTDDPLQAMARGGGGGAGEQEHGSRPLERLLLIVGPPGVGKTTLAHVIAAHCGYEAREVNASSDRTVSVLDAMISDGVANTGRVPHPSSAQPQQQSINHSKHSAAAAAAAPHPQTELPTVLRHLLRPKCLIIDEMDGIHTNVVNMLLKKDIHRPVLCLANNLYAPALRELRAANTTVVHIPPIVPQRLVQRLEHIAANERLDVDRGTLAELVQVSNGDIRCCLNTLQFLKRAPGEARVSAHELQRAMAQLRGKDTTLGLWPLWTATFAKRDKQKYLSLLLSEFKVDWEAIQRQQEASAAATAAATPQDVAKPLGPPRKKSRVDPGFVYLCKKLNACGDMDTFLEGLFQHYSQQRYSDYALDKTQRCTDAMAFQDLIQAHGYRHNAVGLADRFGAFTGAACYASCSSLSRGPTLTFPREMHQCRDEEQRGEEAARMFVDHMPGPVASMYSSTPTVALDMAPLFTRCLINTLIKFPNHSIASIRTLSSVDQRLLKDAVDRHVAYGVTYGPDDAGSDRRDGKSNRDWKAANNADGSARRWVLRPPIHALGCVGSKMNSIVEAPGGSIQSGTTAGGATSRGAAAPVATAAVDGRSQSRPLVVNLRDEVKQLLAGEINTAKIRLHQASLLPSGHPSSAPVPAKVAPALVHSPAAGTSAEEKTLPGLVPLGSQDTPSSAAPSVSVAAIQKKTPVKRDFFGRPIAARKPTLPAPPAPPLSADPGNQNVTPQKAMVAKKLPPTHDVKYVNYDGSTNAVKLPALLSDFE